MKIKQAVIPAAGMGSKFLPITKNVPKELLPLFDKPCIQQVIEEGVQAGVEEFVIVIAADKIGVKQYFDSNPALEERLLKHKKDLIYKKIKDFEKKAKYQFVVQSDLLGLGHAVMCAKPYITDDYFYVILPDDVIDAEQPVCVQMSEVFRENQKPVIAAMEVPWDHVHRYGIIEARPLSEKLGDVISIVEKPSRQEAPSNLAIIGRYLLPKDIFTSLEQTKPGAQGEIQLTDAIKDLIKKTGLHSYSFHGERYDAGTPTGLLCASLVMALKDPAYREQIGHFVKILAASI